MVPWRRIAGAVGEASLQLFRDLARCCEDAVEILRDGKFAEVLPPLLLLVASDTGEEEAPLHAGGLGRSTAGRSDSIFVFRGHSNSSNTFVQGI